MNEEVNSQNTRKNNSIFMLIVLFVLALLAVVLYIVLFGNSSTVLQEQIQEQTVNQNEVPMKNMEERRNRQDTDIVELHNTLGGLRTEEPVVVNIEGIGEILTDGESGITLYTRIDENCEEDCLSNDNFGPLLTILTYSDSDDERDVSSERLRNGRLQLTWKGKLLYTFTGDKVPGDTFGDGFDDGEWTIARP